MSASLRDCFDALVDLRPTDRAHALQAMGLSAGDQARLHALLAATDEAPRLLQTPAVALVDQWRGDPTIAEHLIGEHVGPFRITDWLGNGGSSIVFKGERDAGDGAQIVALKLLQTGRYSAAARQRFAREQAILATLTHPNIARLIEGGLSASGVPYIAMEYVEGLPITRHAEAASASLMERLRIFHTLCLAVEAAHGSLVVHRDLKPSNVFIDRHGVVKVLDFGLAKLLDDSDSATTHTQAIMLTPDYAAPEQFHAGPVTTAVDVYALGVILGELLTGRLLGRHDARNASIAVSDESARAVPRGLAARRMLARQLRGDLDAILATALAEEATQRYRSAGMLAEDIQRFLGGRPVRAHPPSRWYRAQKFVRRHRGGVMMTGVVTLVVLASLVISVWQWRIARTEATRANITRDFLVHLFTVSDAGMPRDSVPTTQALLRDAGRRIDDELVESPALRSEMQLLIGNVSRDLGLLDDAAPLLQKAAQSADVLYVPGEKRWVEAKIGYGTYLLAHGDYHACIDLLSDVVGRTPPLDTNIDQLGHALSLLAHAKSVTGRGEDAKADLAHAHALIFSARGEQSLQAYKVLGEEAEFAYKSADYKKAIELKRAVLEGAIRLFGADHAEVLQSRYSLAESLHRAGDLAEAEQLIVRCEQEFSRYYPTPNELLVDILSTLGSIQVVKGELDAAQKTFGRAYQLQTNELIGSHTLGTTLHNLAAVAQQRDDNEEALRYAEMAADAKRRLFGPDSAEYGSVLRLLGQIQSDLKRYDEAVESLVQSSTVIEKATSADNPMISNNHVTLAKIELARGHISAAREHVHTAIGGLRKAYGDTHRFSLIAAIYAAKIELAGGDAAAALVALRLLETTIRRGDAALKKLLPSTLESIADAELASGNRPGAESAWREALALRLAAGARPQDDAVRKLQEHLQSTQH
ncbi:MAG: serine/threonine-protein kinase [Tahibacter sp.]